MFLSQIRAWSSSAMSINNWEVTVHRQKACIQYANAFFQGDYDIPDNKNE